MPDIDKMTFEAVIRESVKEATGRGYYRKVYILAADQGDAINQLREFLETQENVEQAWINPRGTTEPLLGPKMKEKIEKAERHICRNMVPVELLTPTR